jgi:tRNA(fMet)-specific endonuclease VapC
MADFLGLPSTVLGELYAGFLIGDMAERNMRELDAFLAEAGVEILGMGRREAERYGALVKAMREIGRPIPTNDLWIAAYALCADARLLTSDTHFAAVPGLIAMGWLRTHRRGALAADLIRSGGALLPNSESYIILLTYGQNSLGANRRKSRDPPRRPLPHAA